MAMSWIWSGMLLLAILCGVGSGRMEAVSAAVLEGASQGVELSLSLAGPLCLWSGFAAVMEHSGLSAGLTRLLRPLLRRLFPKTAEDAQTMGSLCGNFTANLLGLGNAATPLGIETVQRMRAASGTDTATDEMCRLVVLNTASIQLIPTTVAALRAGMGAARPFAILPAVWVTSLLSVTAGLAAAKGFSLWRR